MLSEAAWILLARGNLEIATSFDRGSELSKVVISVLQYGTEMKG